MANVVGVHGIAQELKGARVLAAAWLPAMLDGIENAGVRLPADPVTLEIAYYGSMFRRAGTMGPDVWPPLAAADLRGGDEAELLRALWAAAASIEATLPGPD